MEYKKIMNMSDNRVNQPSRFRTKNLWKYIMIHVKNIKQAVNSDLKL